MIFFTTEKIFPYSGNQDIFILLSLSVWLTHHLMILFHIPTGLGSINCYGTYLQPSPRCISSTWIAESDRLHWTINFSSSSCDRVIWLGMGKVCARKICASLSVDLASNEYYLLLWAYLWLCLLPVRSSFQQPTSDLFNVISLDWLHPPMLYDCMVSGKHHAGCEILRFIQEFRVEFASCWSDSSHGTCIYGLGSLRHTLFELSPA